MTADGTVVDAGALERLRRIGGQDFLVEMIALFLENAPKRIDAALEGLAAVDHTAVYRAAHSLKSTAGNLGATTLQMLSERVERHAAARETAAIAPLMDELVRQFAQVRERLEEEPKQRVGR